MPVQFYCPHCRQLLKVGRRKIGSLVACPRCGAPTMVPTAEGGSTPMPEESSAGFDEVNELLRQSPMLAPAPAPAAPASWASGAVQPTSPTRIAISADAHSSDMLLVSRTAIYAQAGLFLLVACVAFAAGYWIGHSRAPGETGGSTPTVKADPVRLSGNISFSDPRNQPAGDDGAVIIALPGRPPRQKLKASGLRPDDAADAVHDEAISRLHAAGGDYARANTQGAYELVVPAPAEYQLLVISRHALRPLDEHLPERDLKLLAPFFEVVTDVIGTHRYAIANRRLAGQSSWSYTFSPGS